MVEEEYCRNSSWYRTGKFTVNARAEASEYGLLPDTRSNTTTTESIPATVRTLFHKERVSKMYRAPRVDMANGFSVRPVCLSQKQRVVVEHPRATHEAPILALTP